MSRVKVNDKERYRETDLCSETYEYHQLVHYDSSMRPVSWRFEK